MLAYSLMKSKAFHASGTLDIIREKTTQANGSKNDETIEKKRLCVDSSATD